MASIRQLWIWLGDERNRGRLALVGAGFATVVAAAWALYVHFVPLPAQTVKLEAPKDPIKIDLNMKIDHTLRVKVEKDLDAVVKDNTEIF